MTNGKTEYRIQNMEIYAQGVKEISYQTQEKSLKKRIIKIE